LPNRIFRTAVTIVLSLVGIILALTLLLRWYEPRLIYLPPAEIKHTPADLGWPYQDLFLTSADRVKLNAWFIPAAAPAELTVLFLHGNAGNISDGLEKLAVLRGLGADILTVDYRGYGRSGGRADEAGTYRDADAAYAWLVRERGVDPRRIVLYGESLGAAVAVDLAAREPVGGVVLESAFSSGVDVAQEMFPFLPVRLLVRNRYESRAKIGRVHAPILILHSRDDEYFKWHHPQQLLAAAKAPARLVELRGSHSDPFLRSAQTYRQALNEFLSAIPAARPAP